MPEENVNPAGVAQTSQTSQGSGSQPGDDFVIDFGGEEKDVTTSNVDVSVGLEDAQQNADLDHSGFDLSFGDSEPKEESVDLDVGVDGEDAELSEESPLSTAEDSFNLDLGEDEKSFAESQDESFENLAQDDVANEEVSNVVDDIVDNSVDNIADNVDEEILADDTLDNNIDNVEEEILADDVPAELDTDPVEINTESPEMDIETPDESDATEMNNQISESDVNDEIDLGNVDVVNQENDIPLEVETSQDEVNFAEDNVENDQILAVDMPEFVAEPESEEGIESVEPIQEEFSVQEELPVQEEQPIQEEFSVQEELPVQEEQPVQEIETPVQEKLSIQEEQPVQEIETPVQENLSIQEEQPVQEELPTQEEQPATLNLDMPIQESTPEESMPQEIQSTLSLDQILDSEILSNPEFADNSVATPNNVINTTGFFENKKVRAILVGVGLFVLIGFVAVLAFPSGNSVRQPHEVVDTGDVIGYEEEHGSAIDEPLFPEVLSGDSEEGGKSSEGSEEPQHTVGGATSVVFFPDVSDEEDTPITIEPGLYTGVNIFDEYAESDNSVSVDEAKSIISSFKSQAESYYSYGQELQDRYLIKYATQIKYLCNNYEQKVTNGEGLDQESLSAFKAEVANALTKIDTHNNGGESTVVFQSNSADDKERNEITDYIYNR